MVFRHYYNNILGLCCLYFFIIFPLYYWILSGFLCGKVELLRNNVTLSQYQYTYNGTERKASVTVRDDSKTLEQDKDYTVSYYDNVNAGTATATVTGIGNYTGTVEKNFTIRSKSISGCQVTVTPDPYPYDGTAAQPYITVEDDTRSLSQDWDYTVTYENNTGIGTAKVTISGKGNYTGTVTKSFEISAKPISDCLITLNPSTFVYDGTAKLPAVTVKDGSRTLTNGTDYTVSDTANHIDAG